MKVKTEPRHVWIATRLIREFADPSEPTKYPELYTEFIEKSELDARDEEVKRLQVENKRLNEEIEALTHEGRQGELEQANVGLADENRRLKAIIDKTYKECVGRDAAAQAFSPEGASKVWQVEQHCFKTGWDARERDWLNQIVPAIEDQLATDPEQQKK